MANDCNTLLSKVPTGKAERGAKTNYLQYTHVHDGFGLGQSYKTVVIRGMRISKFSCKQPYQKDAYCHQDLSFFTSSNK